MIFNLQIERFFMQSIAMAQSILDDKMTNITRVLNDIEISQELLESPEEEKLAAALEQNLKNQIDFLIFMPQNKENPPINAGNFLYDLEPLIAQLTQDISLHVTKLVVTQNKKQPLVFLLSSKKILDAKSGKVLGLLLAGIELGSDSSFFNSIKKITKLSDLYLIANGIAINKQNSILEQRVLNITIFNEEQQSIWMHKNFTFENEPATITLAMQLQTDELKDITMQLRKDIIIMLVLFGILLTQLIYLIKFMLTRPLSKLQFYTENLAYNAQNAQAPNFHIIEYKNLCNHLKTLFAQLQESRKIIDTNMRIIDQHVLTTSTDIHANIIEASSAFCKLSGYSKEELLGKNHRIMKSDHTKEQTYKELWNTIKHGKTWEGEMCNKAKDGSLYWTHNIITPIQENGKIIKYTAIREDITHKRQLEDFAIKDPLTNLYNRRYMQEALLNAQKLYSRHKEPFSLIIVDIDFFKKINDTYGHQTGDSVLKEFANLLSENTRQSDKVSRWGGEEFLIFTPKTTLQNAFTLAVNICNKIAQHQFVEAGHVTASFGVAAYENCIDNTIKNADEALYKAKELGRNQVQLGI